ncbi:MAG TPA: hypothetical protein VMD27_06540 [Candidatus Aquilonibacter sp.]|nr:hypothetical protein [Candidatus Aquilonibacter sp.]
MPHDSIPPADPDFHTWFGGFYNFVSTNAATLNVTPDQATTLTNVYNNWKTAYPAHKTAEAAAGAAVTVKNQARDAAESVLRPLIQQFQASTTVTDDQRKNMKITVRATTRTRSSAPTTMPVASVDTSQRLRHIINYKDSSGNRAKPAGVAYCEIWAKVGAPAPTDISQMTYLGNASKTPQLEEFTAAQAGQVATYWLRWVSTRGDKGPWSEPISATIPG